MTESEELLNLKNMALHSEKQTKNYTITRVPNGWIYRYNNSSLIAVYVPEIIKTVTILTSNFGEPL